MKFSDRTSERWSFNIGDHMVMFDCICKNTDTPSYTSNYVMVKMKNNNKKKKNTITFKIDHIYTWYKYSVQRSHPCSITSIKTKLKVKFWKYMAYQKESTFYLHKKKHKNNNNSWQPYSQRKCSITSLRQNWK